MQGMKETVSTRLRVRMAEVDMNASQLAAAAKVSADSVRKYRRGETTPTLEVLCKLAEALNCTPNDLCGFGTERGCA